MELTLDPPTPNPNPTDPTETAVATLDSPVGPLTVITRGGRLCGLAFDGALGAPEPTAAEPPDWVAGPLRRYFAGELDALDKIPLDFGGTAFQHAVWTALRAIPPGATVAYRDVATMVGRPTSSRAVGNAVGSNPIAIVVPCHRVITSGGGLGGFGGGLDRKRWLLAHEGEGQLFGK